ncbi:arginine repressor [Candidatus Latescibacterota bacterium]
MLDSNGVENAAGKLKRQNTIRDILNNKTGTTHEEIIRYLGEKGIKASQSTLSRDLREMGVIKIPLNGGKAYYRLSESARRTARTISNYPISFETVGNLLVIKTSLGSAPGLCVFIDNQKWNEIAGTIAGDDTILVILRNPSDAVVVVKRLERLRNEI